MDSEWQKVVDSSSAIQSLNNRSSSPVPPAAIAITSDMAKQGAEGRSGGAGRSAARSGGAATTTGGSGRTFMVSWSSKSMGWGNMKKTSSSASTPVRGLSGNTTHNQTVQGAAPVSTGAVFGRDDGHRGSHVSEAGYTAGVNHSGGHGPSSAGSESGKSGKDSGLTGSSSGGHGPSSAGSESGKSGKDSGLTGSSSGGHGPSSAGK